MAEVVFVTPNFKKQVTKEPIGTLLLATILNNSGIDTKILPFHQFGDVQDFDNFIDNAAQRILAQNPAVVSFYTRCDSYHISIKIAQQIKRTRGGVYLVFGGPQADITAEDTLRAVPEIDYICCGEGETTVVPFFSSLIAGNPNHEIPGLVFRDQDTIAHNPRPPFIEDLDTLPAVDYSLLDGMNDGEQPAFVGSFPVDVGRGCPFSCAFCSTKTFWGRKYRLKSAGRIISEIREIHELFGLSSFTFEHDMFTMDRKRVIQTCRELMGIGFPISWGCSARLDCLDEELIDIMAAAGMNNLYVGIETGSQEMQRRIHKNLKLADVYDKLSYISAKGIKTTASFIFGFPEETEEDFEQTMAMMVKLCALPKVHLQHHLCAFYSGTELTQKYMGELERMSVFSDATGEIAVEACRDLIAANPKLFPHYFEYKSELREKIKYFPRFFRYWVSMRPGFEYIAERYYHNRYCQMLYDFSASNEAALAAGKTQAELLREDKFLDRFREDANDSMLQEMARFARWKEDTEAFGREVFAFDINAMQAGKPFSDIGPKLTLASARKNAAGKRKITIYG